MPLPSPTIHRKGLSIVDEQILTVPRGAVLLHVEATYIGVTKDNPQIEVWYHCDLDEPAEKRRIRVVGTGHQADVDPATHVGTVIHDLPAGRGVWHVFDLGVWDDAV